MVERQGEYGQHLPAETFAGGTIPFNRFVKRDASDYRKFIVCGANEDADGLAEYDFRGNNIDGSPRTGWVTGEELAIKESGIGIILTGEVLNVGDYVKSGANGVAMKYEFPAPASAYAKGTAEAMAAMPKLVKGKVIKGAGNNELVKVKLRNLG